MFLECVCGGGGDPEIHTNTSYYRPPAPHVLVQHPLWKLSHYFFGAMPYNRHALHTIHFTHFGLLFHENLLPSKKILYETLPITGMITEQMLGTSGCIVP